jgi:hypothetical protein
MDIDEPQISDAVRHAFSSPSAVPKDMSLAEFVAKTMEINEGTTMLNFGHKIGEYLDDTFNDYRRSSPGHVLFLNNLSGFE